MRKKILTLAAVATLAVVMTACGTAQTSNTPTPTAEPTTAPTATSTPTVEPTTEPTVAPTATSTPTPEPTATSTPTPEPTATSTPTPEPTATSTPTPEPTPTEAPHEHVYTEVVTLEATCTVDGEKTFTCVCSDSYKEAITALGHAYVEDETTKVEATCEVDGKASDKKCSVCGDVVAGEVITATGHIFETYTSNNDATYTADGTETAKCNNCDVTDTRVAEGSMLTYSYTDMDATMYAQQTVNVRSLPCTDGEKLGDLSTNDEVKVTGQCAETSWYRIEYNGQVGYVSSNYLGSDKVVVQTQSEKLASHFGITLPCTTTVNSRIYRDDSITYTMVWKTLDGNTGEGSLAGHLHDGTSVTIHELYGNESKCWAYITTADGLTGYTVFSDSYSQRVSSTGAFFSW